MQKLTVVPVHDHQKWQRFRPHSQIYSEGTQSIATETNMHKPERIGTDHTKFLQLGPVYMEVRDPR